MILDIFLLVIPYLSVRDVMTMRRVSATRHDEICTNFDLGMQASKYFRDMTRRRRVWSLLIHTHVLEKDIPVPHLNGRSIASLPAEELERLTCAALRLRKTWSSVCPKPIKKNSFHPTQNRGAPSPVSLQFLPGRGNRWLLSTTLMSRSSMRIQCWDTRSSPPKCIASCHLVIPLSFVVNTDPQSRWVFAFQDP
jgi:hypothetical protein